MRVYTKLYQHKKYRSRRRLLVLSVIVLLTSIGFLAGLNIANRIKAQFPLRDVKIVEVERSVEE